MLMVDIKKTKIDEKGDGKITLTTGESILALVGIVSFIVIMFFGLCQIFGIVLYRL